MTEEELRTLFGYLQEIVHALGSIDAGLTRLVELAEAAGEDE